MNSIRIDYSLRVNVGQTVLNLFIGGNRVIAGSESSIVGRNVYIFVQDSPILFQWSVATLFQYAFAETFTAKCKLIRGDVIAVYVLLHRHGISVHLNSSLNRPGSLNMLFVFYTTCSGEKLCYSISSETTETVNWSQPLPFRSHFRSFTIFQFFFGKSKIQRICVHLQYTGTAISQITFLSLSLLKVAQLQLNTCKESVLGYVV